VKLLNLEASLLKTQRRLAVFKVISQIDKSFAGLDGIMNLELNQSLGGYPFLAGKDTYESSGGFLAQEVEPDFKV
jgi:hypothetical protein